MVLECANKMNILFYILLFVIAFVLGAVFMAFAYAWNVQVNNRVLVVDKKVGYSRFMDRTIFVSQEIKASIEEFVKSQ